MEERKSGRGSTERVWCGKECIDTKKEVSRGSWTRTKRKK